MWYISVVLPGGLRAEDLDDAPARHAADPEREVERERPGRNDADTHLGALVAHAHDGALAELTFDLGERALEGGIAGLGGLLVFGDGHGRRTFLLWRRRAILRPGADGTDPRSGSCGGATPLCSDSAKNLFQLSAQTPVDTGIARDSVRRRVDGAAHVRTPPSRPAGRRRTWCASLPPSASERPMSPGRSRRCTHRRRATGSPSPTSRKGDAMSYADVNGLSLYYEEHGAGEPLVLLHGGFGAAELMQPIIPALAAATTRHRGRPPGSRPHGRHRSPAAAGAHGGRHRRAHRVPRPRAGRRDGLLARRGRSRCGPRSSIPSASVGSSSSRSPSGATARTPRCSRRWTRWDPPPWSRCASRRSASSTRGRRHGPSDWPALVAKTADLLQHDYDWTAEIEAMTTPDAARVRRRGLDPAGAHRRVLRAARRRPPRRRVGPVAATGRAARDPPRHDALRHLGVTGARARRDVVPRRPARSADG